MKYLRIDCSGSIDGKPASCSMTGIQVCFEDNETDFEAAKAKALIHIFRELDRYGLSEALNGLQILDEYGRRKKAKVDAWLAAHRQQAIPAPLDTPSRR